MRCRIRIRDYRSASASGGMDISYLYPNNRDSVNHFWGFRQVVISYGKNQIYPGGDSLRIRKLRPTCGYHLFLTISQNFSGSENLSFVGEIATFVVRRYLSLPDDICNILRFSLHSRHLQLWGKF